MSDMTINVICTIAFIVVSAIVITKRMMTAKRDEYAKNLSRITEERDILEERASLYRALYHRRLIKDADAHFRAEEEYREKEKAGLVPHVYVHRFCSESKSALYSERNMQKELFTADSVEEAVEVFEKYLPDTIDMLYGNKKYYKDSDLTDEEIKEFEALLRKYKI